MAKKKRKKLARKQAKKRAAKRKKSMRKSTLKKKKSVRKASRKPKLKKKALKKKGKSKKARKSAPKKKHGSTSHVARKTLSTAHEIHHEKRVGPEGQAFEGYDQHASEETERHSPLDANVHPLREGQENPEEKISAAEDRPGDDPDAEDLDDLGH